MTFRPEQRLVKYSVNHTPPAVRSAVPRRAMVGDVLAQKLLDSASTLDYFSEERNRQISKGADWAL